MSHIIYKYQLEKKLTILFNICIVTFHEVVLCKIVFHSGAARGGDKK